MSEAIRNHEMPKAESGLVTSSGEYTSPQGIDALNAFMSGTKYDWRLTTLPSLRGHIVRDHIRPGTLATYGVARYDIELAAYLGFDLNWVAKKVVERLREDDNSIQTRLCEDLPHLKVANKNHSILIGRSRLIKRCWSEIYSIWIN